MLYNYIENYIMINNYQIVIQMAYLVDIYIVDLNGNYIYIVGFGGYE